MLAKFVFLFLTAVILARSNTVQTSHVSAPYSLSSPNLNNVRAVNAESAVYPAPVVDAALAINPAPVVNPVPEVDPAPVVDAALAINPAPVVDPVTVDNPVPVVNPKPVVHPPHVVDPVPVVDPKPVVHPPHVVDPVPAVDPKPVVHPPHVVDPVPAVDPIPAHPVPFHPHVPLGSGPVIFPNPLPPTKPCPPSHPVQLFPPARTLTAINYLPPMPPSPTLCNINEIYLVQGIAPNCDTVCSTLTEPCNVYFFVPPSGCYCLPDHARDLNNVCVPISECPISCTAL